MHSSNIERPWHALLRVEPIDDVHMVYAFFDTLRVAGRDVAVAIWPSTHYHIYWPRWLKRTVPVFNHLALTLQALRAAPSKRVVLVREFDNTLFLLMTPLLWWLRKRLVLNINSNFTMPLGRGPRAAVVRALSRMGFRFLLLDGEPARLPLAEAFPGIRIATPMFPVLAQRRRPPAARENGRMTIGFVANFRHDKGGRGKATEAILRVAAIDGVTVRVGFWNAQARADFATAVGPHIELCSTATLSDYYDFIESCDAVVIMAEERTYYWRHSAILMDCINHRTIPICPGYPVFSSIVSQPVPVGVLYDTLADLPAAVRSLFDARDALQGGFAAHAAHRTPALVENAIDDLVRDVRGPRVLSEEHRS